MEVFGQIWSNVIIQPMINTLVLLYSLAFSNFGIAAHIHAHSKSQKHYENKDVKIKKRTMPKRSFEGLVDNLHSSINKMSQFKFSLIIESNNRDTLPYSLYVAIAINVFINLI